MIKFLFLLIYSTTFFISLLAEEEEPSESHTIYIEVGKLSVPLSWYTDDWDPKEQLPLMLQGKVIDEKNFFVDIDKSIREAMKKQDELRSENSWLADYRRNLANYQRVIIESEEDEDDEEEDDQFLE